MQLSLVYKSIKNVYLVGQNGRPSYIIFGTDYQVQFCSAILYCDITEYD